MLSELLWIILPCAIVPGLIALIITWRPRPTVTAAVLGGMLGPLLLFAVIAYQAYQQRRASNVDFSDLVPKQTQKLELDLKSASPSHELTDPVLLAILNDTPIAPDDIDHAVCGLTNDDLVGDYCQHWRCSYTMLHRFVTAIERRKQQPWICDPVARASK